jgi:hypothetical protein
MYPSPLSKYVCWSYCASNIRIFYKFTWCWKQQNGTSATVFVLWYQSMKTRHGEKCVVSHTEDNVPGESGSIVFGLSARPLCKESIYRKGSPRFVVS